MLNGETISKYVCFVKILRYVESTEIQGAVNLWYYFIDNRYESSRPFVSRLDSFIDINLWLE